MAGVARTELRSGSRPDNEILGPSNNPGGLATTYSAGCYYSLGCVPAVVARGCWGWPRRCWSIHSYNWGFAYVAVHES